jgi:uncharacterized protein YjbI with pentapeptide repeats
LFWHGRPVKYDHIIVKGDLDLSQLSLQTNISSPIRINDSTFDGIVSSKYIVLDEPFNLSGSNFTKDLYFKGSTFNGCAYFHSSNFSGIADIERSRFNSSAEFGSSKFNLSSDFQDSMFINAIADFVGCEFNGPANFVHSNFSSILAKYSNFNSYK